MRAAARRQIEPLYLYEPQVGFARGIFTQRKTRGLFFRHLADAHGAVFPDDAVGKLDRLVNFLFRRSFKRHVNLGILVEHPKTARLRVEEGDESLRENVLARVLLNVVQAARPIDASLNNCASQQAAALQDVKHALFACVYALYDARVIECSSVARLPASHRVERCAVECDGHPPADALRYPCDASLKLRQM